MTDPLTLEELLKIKDEALAGKEFKIYMVFGGELGPPAIAPVTITNSAIFLYDDKRESLYTIDWMPGVGGSFFTNYWHAYAYKLKLEDQ